MARVEPDDTATIGVLTDPDRTPVGRTGQVDVHDDQRLHWTLT